MKSRHSIFHRATPIASILFVAGALTGTVSLVSQPIDKTTERPTHVPNEVIVAFHEYSYAGRVQAMNTHGMRSVRRIASGQSELFRIPKGQSLAETMDRLRENPDVAFVEPNYIYYKSATSPNDGSYSSQWGLKNTGQVITDPMDIDFRYSTSAGTSGKDINAEAAWDVITDCSSVTVAVIDSGTNYNHSDLSANMWNGASCVDQNGGTLGGCTHGYDFVSNDKDPNDEDGHGTHVAGLIGAAGNNSSGIAGVCWNADIMAVRVLNSNGSGTTADIADGINFAWRNGAKIINLSLGGGGFSTTMSNAINNARTAGALVVVAAGNSGLNLESNNVYPCEYTHDNLICVAALDQNYNLATFSNYGSTGVDVGGPGTNMVSAYPWALATHLDFFDTGWTFTGEFGRDTNTDFCSGPAALSLPSNWCSSAAGKYSNGITSQASKTYTISAAADRVILQYRMHAYIGATDFWTTKYDNDSTPFDGLTVNFLSTSNGGFTNYTHNLTLCAGNTSCSVGFQFNASSTGNDFGMAIESPTDSNYYRLETRDTDSTTSYDLQSGTSQATPIVAGIANMLFAYNPSFTYTDVRTAILTTGDAESALSGKTTTGRAADAYAALGYIPQTTGVSASP